MKYMIVIYETEGDFKVRPGKMGAWQKYTEALQKAGVMTGGAGLQPPATGTTVRLRDGRRQVQDGPYADTKEQLGGFYLIDVPDLDAALGWAEKCPAAASGAVEVRPLLVMG